MKALVYTGPRQVAFRDEPDPFAAAGEVVLAVEAAGICGSDMHAFHGHDPRRVPPLILGHELSGRVADGPRKGTRVTVNPLATCGRCAYCVTGRDNLCTERTMIGMSRPGAFAEYVTVPERTLIEVPAAMGARAAALTEPAATALHAVNAAMRVMARPLPESAVLVIGAGAVGLLCAMLVRSYGCRDVILAETNPLRRASAEAEGLRTRDPLALPAAPGNVAELVIDAVGASPTRKTAIAAVRPGGVVLHIGLQDWTSEIDMRKLTLGEITLVGTYTYSTADLRATVTALHGGVFGTLGWVEERPMSGGAAAFADLDAGRTGAAKILLVPH